MFVNHEYTGILKQSICVYSRLVDLYPVIVIFFASFMPYSLYISFLVINNSSFLAEVLSHHPVYPSTHITAPILSHCHFPFFAVQFSSHPVLPPTLVFPTISMSFSSFTCFLLISCRAGLESALLVLGVDSSLKSLIKHLQTFQSHI